MSKEQAQPLDDSNLSGRYRAFRVDVFAPRKDGLVYSSDGISVHIQAGMDTVLEEIADLQRQVLDDTDGEELRSEMDIAILDAELKRSNGHELSNMQALRMRVAILRQIGEMSGLDTI